MMSFTIITMALEINGVKSPELFYLKKKKMILTGVPGDNVGEFMESYLSK